jgi:hypothetical protein
LRGGILGHGNHVQLTGLCGFLLKGGVSGMSQNLCANQYPLGLILFYDRKIIFRAIDPSRDNHNSGVM